MTVHIWAIGAGIVWFILFMGFVNADCDYGIIPERGFFGGVAISLSFLVGIGGSVGLVAHGLGLW